MSHLIRGTFHFHSTYSHDGKSTLAEIAAVLRAAGCSFCVVTEHFEDLDADKFDRYIGQARRISEGTGFLMIPGVEVDLSGLHTIIFPAQNFAEIVRLATEGVESRPLFKVLAHPSKYGFDQVAAHLDKYRINGIELWNQQADGSHIPPVAFLKKLQAQPWRHQFSYFFGCDIHKVSFAATNFLSVSTPGAPTVDAVVNALIEGNFTAINASTGISYDNAAGRTDLDRWLVELLSKPYYRGKLLRAARYPMKSAYRMLPREVQHSLNDVKNYIRNKV